MGDDDDLPDPSNLQPSTQPSRSCHLTTWKKVKLSVLSGGKTQTPSRIPQATMNEEALLMKMLSYELEDTIPDDGAIEIDNDEVYRD